MVTIKNVPEITSVIDADYFTYASAVTLQDQSASAAGTVNLGMDTDHFSVGEPISED